MDLDWILDFPINLRMTNVATRLASLDQFRGYTVAAMFLVNFLGGYSSVPAILRHHHTWCSYADTVMPQFFFAVGMALRLVMLRETEQQGQAQALWRGTKRGILLLLLGWFWYHPGREFASWHSLTELGIGELIRELFLTNVFQALTHIGAVTLWVLPVITGGARLRIGFAVASAGLHVWLSHAFWYETLQQWGVIDGGPLGFLTWTLPVIAGSLTLDAIRSVTPCAPSRMAVAGALTMAAGYALACLTQGGVLAAPPFVPPWHASDLWTMSQRAGSVSYLLFSTGFSISIFAFFAWWSDRKAQSLRLFTDLGQNALAAYLVHMVVMDCLECIGPSDSPLAWALLLSTIGFLVSWCAVRWLNERRLFLRL